MKEFVRRVLLNLHRFLRYQIPLSLLPKRMSGQNNEDGRIFDLFFSNRPFRGGFFVEIGAYDGILFSNSLFFEEYLGWKGLLIEPLPQAFAQLQKNRPQCLHANSAVSRLRESVYFLGSDNTAGMPETMSESFRKTWHNEDQTVQRVPAAPISEIIGKFDIHRIDLFSIDVEGAELEVLETFDWNITVWIVLIELDGHNPEKDESCRSVLRRNGFEWKADVPGSEIWHHPDHSLPF